MVAKRYERGSIVLTSNLTFGGWDQALAGDAVLTAAMLDRLMHHAAVVQIGGDSYGCATREKAALCRKSGPSSDDQTCVDQFSTGAPHRPWLNFQPALTSCWSDGGA